MTQILNRGQPMLQLLAERRRGEWNAIRKRKDKPAWLYDIHFVIKDAYMINN